MFQTFAFRLTICGLSMLAQAAPPERVAVLEVEVENSVVYRYDQADPAQHASNSSATPTSLSRAFTDFCQFGDIVAVNGKPAKGVHMTCGTRVGFAPNPQPGFAIGDATIANGRQQCNWELLTPEGRPVGRIVDGGFFPHAVLGGAGAYFGAVGEHQSIVERAPRVASVSEDPSRRRLNGGGGKHKVIFYLTPKTWPEIVMLPEGPAIYHGDNLTSRVSLSMPAKPGELLTLVAKGLGPTLPGIAPAGARVFSGEPFNEVSSPVEITVNGIEADVVNKIGWPGTTDTYRIDFRVPPGTSPGLAAVRLTTAWIPASEIRIPVQ